MSVSDHDLETLETWLDGELTEEQADALRRRLSTEPALAQIADQLRSDRQLRASAWAGLDSGGDVEALIARVRRENRKHELWSGRLQTLRQVSGIAAAIVLMFGAGWISRSRLETAQDQPPAVVATNQNTQSAPAPADANRGNTMLAVDNGLRINRPSDPNPQLASRQSQQPNPLLVPFDMRSLSVTRPRFQVQVLDAFGNVQYVRPMDAFSDAVQLADYIGHFQDGASSNPASNRNIMPVNNQQPQH
jgi:hypothetical protein